MTYGESCGVSLFYIRFPSYPFPPNQFWWIFKQANALIAQARDRQSQGAWFLQSRSARLRKRSGKRFQHRNNANDFKMCLSREHVTDLFVGLDSKQNTCKHVGTLLAQVPNPEIRTDFARRIALNINKKMCGVVDLCVVVDLIRPLGSELQKLVIENGSLRSHSNLPDEIDPSTSCLSEKTDLPPWCPHRPSDQTLDKPDFVIIQTTHDNRCDNRGQWYIEGVALEATGRLAIRVDLEGQDNNVISVANGDLLRPLTSTKVHFEEGGAKRPIQLVPFPEPYHGIQVDRARITIVECDGRGVRVGLLTSQITQPQKRRQTPCPTEFVYNQRTINFEAASDYRDWWCVRVCVCVL